MTIKNVVKGNKDSETVIEWELKQDGNDINLRANGSLILWVDSNGYLNRSCAAGNVKGLKTNNVGRIIEEG